jgi:hypothetical protein
MYHHHTQPFVPCRSGLRLALLFRLAAIVLGLCCRCFLCFSMLLPCAVALVCSPIFGVTHTAVDMRDAEDERHQAKYANTDTRPIQTFSEVSIQIEHAVDLQNLWQAQP